MVKENLVQKIKGKYQKPIIGVIGATSPTGGYNDQIGIDIGYALRKYIHKISGNLFTGGVEGVGIDVYTGVMKFCRDQSITEGMIQDDRFFVLVPEKIVDYDFESQVKIMFDYVCPSTYTVLGKLSRKGNLTSEIAGLTLAERRKYVGQVADLLVVLNGGYGTLDEAQIALRNNIPVVALTPTAGAAKILSDFKTGKLPFFIKRELTESNMDFGLNDSNLIFPAEDLEELIGQVDLITKGIR